ncbi:MAG TPA: methyltransferase domain-containing protein [Ktedonobacteraceae bacterium]|jgi:SAM-dependent methyltransferase
MHTVHLLSCPFCQEALEQTGNTLICSHKHTFDIAREGYVNLLRKKLPGDTREMLVARRTFLERGFYLPLSNALNELVAAQLHGFTQSACVLDAGCGEGYYLGRLQQALEEQGGSSDNSYLGLDISKDAIRMAAKRYPTIDFVVANLKDPLIVRDHALHLLLNIFAPRNPAEFARVLVLAGWLLVVIPAPEHLRQLRETLQLLQIEEQKMQHVVAQFQDDFSLVQTVEVQHKLHLQGEEIVQTVMMTPNYWHMEPEKRQALTTLTTIETEAAFTCLLFQKRTRT